MISIISIERRRLETLPGQAQTAESSERIDGRYRVEQELGSGGMARVCRVLDERSGEQLALKQLIPPARDRDMLKTMFEREYHSLAQLAHPRIVRVFDY